jgi:endonuclease YncB( thermonuclease family)
MGNVTNTQTKKNELFLLRDFVDIDTLNSLTYENTPTFSFSGHSFYAKCVKVYDGDTITVAFTVGGQHYKKSARMNGYDSPELHPKYTDADKKTGGLDDAYIVTEKKWAAESKKKLEELVLNEIVFVKCCKTADKYGRLLADVELHSKANGGIQALADNTVTDVNKTMLLYGFVRPYSGGKKTKWDFSKFK